MGHSLRVIIPALSALVASTGASLAEPAGTLKAGGMEVRLERFIELADGRVQAELTFQNLNGDAPASLALPSKDSGPGSRRAKGADAAHLVNARGAAYRLAEISQFGDVSTDGEWTRVAAGGSTAVTATFVPDGAKRGAQPFALTVPVRMVWRPTDALGQRTSTFDINFRGINRAPTLSNDTIMPAPQAAPQAPVLRENISLPSAAQVAPVPESKVVAGFTDDLAPLIAKLPAARTNHRAYLVAVGADQYDDAPGVPFADRSAKAMSDLLRKRYGIPEENVALMTGADATGMKIIGRLNSMLQRLNTGDTIYFYYAGHGLAARDGNNVYVVPKDAVPGAYEVEMLSLAALLKRFEESKASRVVAFLDTCFSGRVGQKGSLFPGVAPLVPSALPAPAQASSKTTLFMAGQANQFANDYPERGHRLFSYFLMKGLLDGYEDADRLNTFVAREVRRVSAKRGAEYVQEPQFKGAVSTIGETRRPQRAAN